MKFKIVARRLVVTAHNVLDVYSSSALLGVAIDSQPPCECKMISEIPVKEDKNAVLLSLAADIVSAYVSNNSVQASELPKLIREIYGNLGVLATGQAAKVEEPQKEPAVPIKKSITPDFIISLEDGKKFKSLRRHLMTHYNLTPEAYRKKWGLPNDYPMVAPNYAAQRSQLAKAIGLGEARKGTSERKPTKPRTKKAA